ncbi:MAG: ABC transporter substrate-binding protein [Paludibacter sp.]|nr:ABC transporter substrate-binding protein [Paludibacter sp.]
MNRKSLLWILLAIAIIIGGWFVWKKNSAQSNTVKIGAILPLTGSGANYGKSLKQGIDIAVEEVNNSGGINGRMLEIVYEDTKSDAKEGVSAFKKVVAFDRVPIVIGSLSSIILACQPVADSAHIVLINSSAISPKICEKADNFLFSLMVNGGAEAKFIANYFCKNYPSEKIAVLYSNNSSGKDTKDIFSKEMQAICGITPYEQSYELNSPDFRSQLNNIKLSKAKYCFLLAFSSKEFADILNQSKELNMGVQWISYSGIETKETLEFAGNSANDLIYSYPKYNPADTLYSNFQKKYSKRYNSWADIYTVTSYDGVKYLANIMTKYGISALNIQNGLRNTPTYNGIFGNISFSKNKQYVEKELIWKKIENNEYNILDYEK